MQNRDMVVRFLRQLVADVEVKYPTLRESDPFSDWGQGVAWMLDRLVNVANDLERGGDGHS